MCQLLLPNYSAAAPNAAMATAAKMTPVSRAAALVDWDELVVALRPAEPEAADERAEVVADPVPEAAAETEFVLDLVGLALVATALPEADVVVAAVAALLDCSPVQTTIVSSPIVGIADADGQAGQALMASTRLVYQTFASEVKLETAPVNELGTQSASAVAAENAAGTVGLASASAIMLLKQAKEPPSVVCWRVSS